MPIDVGVELRCGEFFQLQLGWPPRKNRDYVRVTLEELNLLQSAVQGKVPSGRENNSMPAAQARFSIYTHIQALLELGTRLRKSTEGEEMYHFLLQESETEISFCSEDD
jgi:hypothetical protein